MYTLCYFWFRVCRSIGVRRTFTARYISRRCLLRPTGRYRCPAPPVQERHVDLGWLPGAPQSRLDCSPRKGAATACVAGVKKGPGTRAVHSLFTLACCKRVLNQLAGDPVGSDRVGLSTLFIRLEKGWREPDNGDDNGNENANPNDEIECRLPPTRKLSSASHRFSPPLTRFPMDYPT